MVAMQAVAEDPTTASLLGINADRFIVLTFYQQFSSHWDLVGSVVLPDHTSVFWVEGSSGNRTGRFRQYSWYGARRFVDWAG